MYVIKLDEFVMKKGLWFVILYLSTCHAVRIDNDALDQQYTTYQLDNGSRGDWTSANIDSAKHNLNEPHIEISRKKRQDSFSNGCNLPSGSELTYIISDANSNTTLNLKPGSKAPRLSMLEITCKNGYALADNGRTYQRSVCHAKYVWVPSLTPCIKTCPTLKPVNADLSCFYGNPRQEITCNQNMVKGTSVAPKCKPFYVTKMRFGFREMKCQKNGKWDHELSECVPDCGNIDRPVDLIYKGVTKTVDQSPWNVAVYRTENYTRSLICGGTIISPRMVVSAAHCFFDRYGKLLNATDFEIVVSKYSRDYKMIDPHQKKHKIRTLKAHERFNENFGHFGYDIAVLVLKEPIKLSKFALPACVDRNARPGFAPGEGTLGNISGWGFIDQTNYGGSPSPVLLTASLPFISYENCGAKMNPLAIDQYCAGSDSGPGARKGDSGSGLLFIDNEEKRYYLRGIVSAGKNDAWQKSTTVAAFTDISHHLRWLETARDALDLEEASAKKSSITAKSYEPTIIDGADDGVCALHSDPNGVIVLYNSYNNIIDLPTGSKAPENSRIEITCKPGLFMPDGKKSQVSVCSLKNGWFPSLTYCSNCGEINNTVPLVAGETTADQAPWNVAVYRNHMLICGGTIITPRMVVSAAHCFFNKNGRAMHTTDFEVVVGKFSRDYNIHDDSEINHKIRKIIVHEEFGHLFLNIFHQDIAVLLLEEPITLSEFAFPACLDWSATKGFQPAKGSFGYMSGWGELESGTPSQFLVTKTLPLISYRDCVGLLTLLVDHFCAGSADYGNLKEEDGTGILSYDNGKYYLRGVVSRTKLYLRTLYQMTILTDISHHLTWLNDKKIMSIKSDS